ncbi:MAG TPA: hypothetical protein VG675_23755 [Bryobacteraceae bacterium]|nr:hypothetical protein [Bryobacteraceae bacterium]
MRPPLVYALLGCAVALGWQALTVTYNYRGDWSSLFDTGAATAVPPQIAGEGVYRFAGSQGYDGQYYHFVAHDPLLLHGFASYVDNPRLRWRRILVPALAFLAAGGQADRIDSAYAIVILGFLFLGIFWLSLWCSHTGLHPAWGLAFLLVPGVFVSLDRFTIDIALAALCAGLIYFAGKRSWPVFIVLALAPLARETGIILIAAYVVWAALRRDGRAALYASLSVLPYAVWLPYLARHTAADQTVFASWMPFYGLAMRTLHPFVDSVATHWLLIAAVLDYVAILGMWVAVVLAAWLVWRRSTGLPEIAAVLFTVVFVAFLSQPQAWSGAYSFARTMSPLLFFLAVVGAAARRWVFLLPLVMAVPRLLFQLGPQWKGILHGLVH